MWSRWGVALAATAALAGCTSTAPPPAPSQTSSSSTTHRVDATALGEQVDEFFADYAANVFKNRQALLVSVDGHTVLERYWRSTATTSGNIESVGKTIMS